MNEPNISDKTIPKPVPPILRHLNFDCAGGICPQCGSSVRKYFKKGCIHPQCSNYGGNKTKMNLFKKTKETFNKPVIKEPVYEVKWKSQLIISPDRRYLSTGFDSAEDAIKEWSDFEEWYADKETKADYIMIINDNREKVCISRNILDGYIIKTEQYNAEVK